MGKLTALKVQKAKPGRHGDGNGLHLLVKESGAKSWLLRVQVDGRRRDFGLGSTSNLTLAEAREKAETYRQEAKRGRDPAAERRKRATPSFEEAAIECHTEMKAAWRSPKHAGHWLTTLRTYAFPALASTPVDAVDAPMMIDVLRPIWLKIPVTARRIHQRIGTVLDFSNGKGWRKTETPTRSVLKSLPKQDSNNGHFAAMPFADLPAYVARLRSEDATVGILALMFTIFTAARSGEVRGATWIEIDDKAKTWTVPASRMKAKKEHIVPLTEAALAILEKVKPLRKTDESVIFSNAKGKGLSDMTLSKILRDAQLPFTVHGFRSSFRDWAAEETEYASEVVEKALAHAIPNKVEAAYRRSDLLEKRRRLMSDWDAYITQPSPASPVSA